MCPFRHRRPFFAESRSSAKVIAGLHRFLVPPLSKAHYHKASAYPGVERDKSLRIHENGVISYAEEDGWDVIIKVDFVRLPEADQQSSK
jgi:hypothetical protein